MPVNAAGWRIDPPVSVPVAAKQRSAATAAAEPPEDGQNLAGFGAGNPQLFVHNMGPGAAEPPKYGQNLGGFGTGNSLQVGGFLEIFPHRTGLIFNFEMPPYLIST